MSVVHRIRLPVGATPIVDVGHAVEPADTLATLRRPGPGTTLPVASRLRRSAVDAADCLQVMPGTTLEAGAVLARVAGREVRVTHDSLFLTYDRDDGSALVAPLLEREPIVGHVRGEITEVAPDAIEIRVGGALVGGVGGSGTAVHGELKVAVHEPAEELRASSIDVAATGRILVGGSRASAETLTRARAMGVAGIVLGGVLDKELRDFEATQHRRRQVGGHDPSFALLFIEGFGKVGMDATLFAWFREQEGRLASLFGDSARLYVYDADPPPARRALPRPGDRVIAHRRPFAGMAGELIRVLDDLHAAPSGVMARSALVRFDDGLSTLVPLANLEATEAPRSG